MFSWQPNVAYLLQFNDIVNLCKKLFLKRWSVVSYLLLYIMQFVIVKVEDFLKLESQSGMVV